MHPDITGDRPQKREGRPVARAAHLESQLNISSQFSQNLAGVQRAARLLSRKPLLSPSVAIVIAAEIVGGGAR